MLALLAAAAVATAGAPAAPSATVSAAAKASAPRSIIFDAVSPRLRNAALCKGAGRLQTSYDPALLYRDQDRDAGQLRRLIDLPDGQACLLGGVNASSAAVPGEGR